MSRLTPFVGWFDIHFTNVITSVLSTGYLPNHVAFIMDGNRRFAKSKKLPAFKGHEAGSASLIRIIGICYKLQIKFITIYAFSIENFNRSKEEVDKLFEILLEKLTQLMNRSNEFKDENQVQVRIIGNKSLIPHEILVQLNEIERLTSGNTDLILNVCFAYTSRDEITNAIGHTIDDVLDDNITINQINQSLIESNFLFGKDVSKVDILVRTSGHTRLSDFLIWQVNDKIDVKFLKVLWPDFKDYHFYQILIDYGFNQLINNLNVERVKNAFFLKDNNKTKSINLKSLPNPPPFVSILGEK